jgi:hypothetical protein
MIMLTELARKVAIRGSVTVGLGLELTDNDLYGPVLAEAHRMESECAEHPRVLVSKEAVDFAQQTYGFSDDPRVDTRDATINRFSAGLICKDQEDGRHIVDFLGETMSSFILAMPFANGARTCVIALYQFASEERDEFKRLACKRLEERYSRLLQYIEPRLRYWDVSLDQR